MLEKIIVCFSERAMSIGKYEYIMLQVGDREVGRKQRRNVFQSRSCTIFHYISSFESVLM